MLGEIYEWPAEVGTGKPCMRGFAKWLALIGETDIESPARLKILHDEYCCHSGRKPVGLKYLTQLVGRAKLIRKYRDGKVRKGGRQVNPTRYRVDVGAVEQAFARAA